MPLLGQNNLQPISRVLGGQSKVNFPTDDYIAWGAGGSVIFSKVVSKDSVYFINKIYVLSEVQDIHIENNILFILDDYHGLFIYDISNLKEPLAISHIDVSNYSYDFLYDSNYVFITHGNNGITKIDVSDLYNPVIKEIKNISALKIIKHDDYYYILTDSDSITILNRISLTENGSFIGGTAFPFTSILDIKFYKNSACLLENDWHRAESKIVFWDFTNPVNPIKGKEIDFSTTIAADCINKDTLFVFLNDSLRIFLLNDNLDFISEYQTDFEGNPLEFVTYFEELLIGSFGYYSGLQIASFNKDNGISDGVFINSFTQAYSLVTMDSLLIVGHDLEGGISIVDISDIKSPVEIHRDFSIEGVEALKLYDDKIYAATQTGLKIYSITEKNSLQLESELNYGSFAWAIDVEDTLVAIGGYYNDVHLINVSNINNLKYLTKIDIQNWMVVKDIILHNNKLFIGGDSPGPFIYDVTDPKNPVELWDGGGYYGSHIALLAKNNILLLGESFGINFIDVNNPSDPKLLFKMDINYWPGNLYIEDSLLFVSGYKDELSGIKYFVDVFDISDLENIENIAFIDFGYYPNRVFFDFPYVFLAANDLGVYIFDMGELTNINITESNFTNNTEYILKQNYPNPFNSATKLEFYLPKSQQVIIKIFNVLGEELETITDRYYLSGNHTVIWDASDYASGIYFYQLRTKVFTRTNKMALIR